MSTYQTMARNACVYCGSHAHASENCLGEAGTTRRKFRDVLCDIEVCTSLDAAQEIAHKALVDMEGSQS